MKRHKPKIGLLPVTLKMFWGLYPELEGKTQLALNTVATVLEKQFDVRRVELVGDVAEAVTAGRRLASEEIDILVVWGNGYVCSNIPEVAIRQLADVPIVLLSTQLDGAVPQGMDYVRYWENSAFTGMVELGGALSKSGIDFKTVVGRHEEPQIYEKLAAFANAAMVKRRLQQLKIAAVGHPYPGMLDIVYDERAVNELGVSIEHISLPEIRNRMQAIAESRVSEFVGLLPDTYDTTAIRADDLFRASQFYCVLEDIARDYSAGAFCMHDYECVSSATGTLSEFALSMAENRLGMAAGCEGDIPNTIGAFILRELTGNSPMFVDWAMFDEPRGAIYFVHNGKADPDIVQSPVMKPTAEPFGIVGDGVVFEVAGKPGPVTMTSIICGKTGWKIFASQGEAIEVAPQPCRQNQFTVKVDRPVRDYLESVCNLGITHHVNIVHGHVAGDIRHLCDMLGAEFVEP